MCEKDLNQAKGTFAINSAFSLGKDFSCLKNKRKFQVTGLGKNSEQQVSASQNKNSGEDRLVSGLTQWLHSTFRCHDDMLWFIHCFAVSLNHSLPFCFSAELLTICSEF